MNDETIDRLARRVHEDYVARQLERGEAMGDRVALRGWEDLTEDVRDANRAQVRGYSHTLAGLGLTIVTAHGDAGIERFSAEELEALAEGEHRRWSDDRLAAGWTYAPGDPSDKLKTTPWLVEYSALPEAEKQKDRDVFLRLPRLLAAVELAISRTGTE